MSKIDDKVKKLAELAVNPQWTLPKHMNVHYIEKKKLAP
jgi:hypothetical protein